MVQQAIAGDPRAVRVLVPAIRPVIHARVGRVLRRCQNVAQQRDVRQEVEDRVQDVFVALFKNGAHALRQWKPERSSLLSFVGLIAERETYSALRSGRRNPWTLEEAKAEE